MTQKLKSVLERVENIVGKGENAGYQHFLLFPWCFQKFTYTASLKVAIVWQSVIKDKFNLMPSELKGLNSQSTLHKHLSKLSAKCDKKISLWTSAFKTVESALTNRNLQRISASAVAFNFPIWQILDSSKLKEITDDNLNLVKMTGSSSNG